MHDFNTSSRWGISVDSADEEKAEKTLTIPSKMSYTLISIHNYTKSKK